MYICICKSLTDTDIRREVFRGDVACMESLRETLGASTGCGCCEAAARDCLNEALASKRLADARSDDRRHPTRAGDLPEPDLPDATPA